MFRKLIPSLVKAVAGKRQNPGPITLRLTCLSLAEGGGSTDLAWDQQGAPEGVIFDVDFLGQPSGVTTGFLWDGASHQLTGVFVVAGDGAFLVPRAFAYARPSHDASGRVGLGWSLRAASPGPLTLFPDETLSLVLDFDPAIKAIRKV